LTLFDLLHSHSCSYITEDSVEEKILAMQTRKQQLAESALSLGGQGNWKLTMDDLMDFFV
jgi:SNF2 family DNA or RNA helicase